MNNTQLNQELKLQAFVNTIVSILSTNDTDTRAFILFNAKHLLKDFGVVLDDDISMKEYLNRVSQEPTNINDRLIHGEDDIHATGVSHLNSLGKRLTEAYSRYFKLQTNKEIFSQVNFILVLLKRIFWSYTGEKPYNVEGGKPSLDTLKKDIVNRRNDLTDDEYKAFTDILKQIREEQNA